MGLIFWKKKKESVRELNDSDYSHIKNRDDFFEVLNSFLTSIKLSYPKNLLSHSIYYKTKSSLFSKSSHKYQIYDYRLNDGSYRIELSLKFLQNLNLELINEFNVKEEIKIGIRIKDKDRDSLTSEIENYIVSVFGGLLFTDRDFISEEVTYDRTFTAQDYKTAAQVFFNLASQLERL